MTGVREASFEVFRAHGMTTMFGNPGSTELPMLRDFPDDFSYVLGLQEAVVVGMADGGTDADTLHLICLSLHGSATYKQFKAGTETLAKYIKEHPDAAATLQGIHLLMQRIDKEKIGKWAQSNKNLDEKEGLEVENKELLERNEILEKAAEQNQVRIRELQQQIEQLKNIENIIKNRER
jgi:hypothetical protein